MGTRRMIKTGSRRIVLALIGLFFSAGDNGGIQAAELMPLKASYAAIGGVFTPVWVAQDNDLLPNMAWR